MNEFKESSEPLPLIDEDMQASWRAVMSPDEIREIVQSACSITLSGLAEIEMAAHRDDRQALRRAAHKLKGMIANLGGVRLAKALLGIELAAATAGGPIPSLEGLAELVGLTVAAFRRSIAGIGSQKGLEIAESAGLPTKR